MVNIKIEIHIQRLFSSVIFGTFPKNSTITNHVLTQGGSNSIISSSWPNQTWSPILLYWLIVFGYEMSANRRAVSLSALASIQNTRNYTILTRS